MQSSTVYQTVLETSKHIHLELGKIKRLCVSGREVVTASLGLTSLPYTGQDVGEQRS